MTAVLSSLNGNKNPLAAQSTGSTDFATFSPAANMMQQLLNMEMKGQGNEESGEVDLLGLTQLKQRGEMLANMLQMKLKNFGATLMSGMNAAGIDSSQPMNLQNGAQGLSLLGDAPNKEGIENLLNTNGKLKEQFQEIAQFAKILDMLQSAETSATGLSKRTSPAHSYAQQSTPNKNDSKRPDAEFVLHVMQGGTSYSFE